MSTHRNPDGSLTDGVKVEPPGRFIAHAFASIGTTAAGIGSSAVANAAAAGATQAIVQAQTNPVFYRLDGVAPTASAAGGMIIPAGGSVTLSMADALQALFIAAAATPIAVTFTM